MEKENVITRTRKVVAYVLGVVGLFLFGFSFYVYAVGEYSEFIASNVSDSGLGGAHIFHVFLASCVRFTLRISYVFSFVGLLFLRRWGVYLCLVAWLGQLLPSTIYFIAEGLPLSDHLISAISLLIYSVVIAFCWPILKPGRSKTYCAALLVSGILLHLVCFTILFLFP